MIPLPDLTAIPEIGTPERDRHEKAALARGRKLLHEYNGHISDALYALKQELRGHAYERETQEHIDNARTYSLLLVSHVEQCWATAILR